MGKGKGVLVATVVAAAAAMTAPAAQAQVSTVMDTAGACTTTPWPGMGSYDRVCYAGVDGANIRCRSYFHFQGFTHYSSESYEDCGVETPVLYYGYHCGSYTQGGGGYYREYSGCDYGPVDTYCDANADKCWVTILAPGVIRVNVAAPYARI